MKYIKYLIILFIMIIIVICILLFSLNSTNNEIGVTNKIDEDINNSIVEEQNVIIENMPNEDDDYNITVETSKKLSYVANRADYFTISALYNKYVNLIGYKNNTLKNVLSTEYINKYNITDNNIFEKLSVPSVENSKQYYKVTITDMLTAEIDSTTYIYIVKGKCRIVGNNTIFSVQVMFEIDTSNQLYNIYPYQYMKDNGIDKLNNGDILDNYTKEEINNREYNKFNYVTKTDLEMANEYFSTYKELLLYYKDDAYNNLNADYSKKRFGTKEAFEAYLNDNSAIINRMTINEYKVNSCEEYTDYICSDKYDNIYIFRQQGGVMRYSVMLDNYTIWLNEDLEQYNSSSEFEKTGYNLAKFMKMVNTKDYKAIYNCLDETFKSNNFNTQDNLKEYIKTNLYDMNSYVVEEYDDETYDYCIYKCKITNLLKSNEEKYMTVIIKLGEGTNFTMSFSFEE